MRDVHIQTLLRREKIQSTKPVRNGRRALSLTPQMTIVLSLWGAEGMYTHCLVFIPFSVASVCSLPMRSVLTTEMVSFVHCIQRPRCFEVVRSFLHLVRWKTLVASLAPSIVVLALALNQGRPLAFFPFFCCGPAPFLLQIGSNLVNDAFDFTRGVDGFKRLGPHRISSRRAALWCYVTGVLCFPAAFLFTLPAIRLRGPIVLKLEIACAVAGYLYTGWPFPYGYYALGDIAVFTFFGIVYFVLASFIIQGRSSADVTF